MRLRHISDHLVLVDEDYATNSGKFEKVIQDIENVISEGHKILVFSSSVILLYVISQLNSGDSSPDTGATH